MTMMLLMTMSSFELCSSAEISGDPQGFPVSLHSEDPFYAVTVEEYLPDDLLRIRRAIRKISKYDGDRGRINQKCPQSHAGDRSM